MTHTARHTTTPTTDRVLSALKAFAAALAIVAVGMAYTVLSVATAATTPGPGHHDTRCALTAYTDAQCAMGFADNALGLDN